MKKDLTIGTSLLDLGSFEIPSKLQNHCLITGATRRGKSYLTSILARIFAKDSAVILLDPHGTLAEQVLEHLSYDKQMVLEADRVIYWDINSKEQTIGYNPLKRIEYIDLDKQVDMLMDACLRVWGQDDFNETPTLARWLFLGFSILIQTGKTMLEAEHIFSLTNSEKRREILEEAKELLVDSEDEQYIDGFEWIERNQLQGLTEEFNWLDKQSSKIQKDEMLSGHNRIFRFLSSATLRVILGQQDGLDLREIMDEKKVLIVNLRPERASKQASRLLALMMTNEIYHLSFSRRNYSDAYIILDEFSTITTRSISEATSETGKYGVWWVLITQFLEQVRNLDPMVLDALITNCITKITFGGMTVRDCEIIGEDMFAGHIDLKEPKLKQTKYRPVLEWMEIVSNSISEGFSDSTTSTESFGKSKGRGHVDGQADVESETQFHNRSKGRGRGLGKGKARGWGSGEGQGSGMSEFSAFGDGFGVSDGLTQRSPLLGYTPPTNHHSNSHFNNNSQGSGRNYHNSSFSSSNESESEFESLSNHESEGEGEGISKGRARSSADITNEAENESQAYGTGHTKNQQTGKSTTLQPVTIHEEYEEIVQYWSLDEQRYKIFSSIKLLKPGTCVIKFGDQAPLFLQVKTIEEKRINLLGDYLKEQVKANKLMIPYDQALENIRSQPLEESTVRSKHFAGEIKKKPTGNEDSFNLF